MDSRCKSSDKIVAACPVTDMGESVAHNTAPVYDSLPNNDDSSTVPFLSSSHKLPNNELLTDKDEDEPDWVWTEPTEDDVKHYLEYMKSIKDRDENESLVDTTATRRLEPKVSNSNERLFY